MERVISFYISNRNYTDGMHYYIYFRFSEGYSVDVRCKDETEQLNIISWVENIVKYLGYYYVYEPPILPPPIEEVKIEELPKEKPKKPGNYYFNKINTEGTLK